MSIAVAVLALHVIAEIPNVIRYDHSSPRERISGSLLTVKGFGQLRMVQVYRWRELHQ